MLKPPPSGQAGPAVPAHGRGSWAVASWPMAALFGIVLVFTLREAQPLLAPVVVAVVLTLLLAPVVRWLRRRGLPAAAGAGVVILALGGSTALVGVALAGPAAEWWRQAPATLAQLMQRLERVRAALPGLEPPRVSVPTAAEGRSERRSNRANLAAAAASAAALAAAAPASAPPPSDPVKEKLASEGLALTGALLGHSLAFTVSALATLILLYFLLASEHWMVSRVLEALPRRRQRALLLGGVRQAQRDIGTYLFAIGCINAAQGVIAGAACYFLGLPSPLLWGVLVAVLSFIPYLGPMMIMGLLLLAGSISFDHASAMLAPVGAYFLIHAIESNLFTPSFVGKRLALSPISVFLSVMFWGWLWGIAGALLATPLLIVLRGVCRRTRGLRLASRFLEGDRREVPSLRMLLRPRQRRARTGAVADQKR